MCDQICVVGLEEKRQSRAGLKYAAVLVNKYLLALAQIFDKASDLQILGDEISR